MSEPVARDQIARLMKQQSTLLALDDIFLIGAFIFVILAGVIWLAVRPEKRVKPTIARVEELTAETIMDEAY